jgi:septin family protein
MTKQQTSEMYITYVQSQLASGQPVATFQIWNEQRLAAEDAITKFSITLHSDVFHARLTFTIQATTQGQAFAIAREKLSALEFKRTTDQGGTSKLLTPAEQVQQAEKQIAQIEKSMTRRLESMNKKIAEAEARLARMTAAN